MQLGPEGTVPVPFDLLLAATSDLVSVHDAGGTVLWANAATERVLGLPPEAFIGTNPFRLVHPDDRPGLVEALVRLRDGPGDLHSFRARARHRDGSYRPVECVARNGLQERQLGAVVVSTRDVTDRSAAETALRVSEARHRQLVEAVPFGMAVVDADGDVRFANPEALALAGQASLADVVGQAVVDFVEPDEPERCRAAFREALDGRSPTPTEYHLLRPDGVPILVLASPLPYSWAGEPAALVVLQDVTRLREAEDESARASAGSCTSCRRRRRASWGSTCRAGSPS